MNNRIFSQEELEDINDTKGCIKVLKTQWQDFIELGMTPKLRDNLILELKQKLKTKYNI